MKSELTEIEYKGWTLVRRDNACWGHDESERFPKHEWHIHAPNERDQPCREIVYSIKAAKAFVNAEVAS